MWWTLATALAGPNSQASLAVVLDDSASERERVKATRALGRLDPADAAVPDVVTPLAATLQTELPKSLPAAIRRTLGRLDATAVWTRELGSESAKERRQAADLLGQEGVAPAGQALIAVLDDPVPSVREAAAGALVAYPDADPVSALATCLQDPSVPVRLAASQSLGFLGGDDAAKALTLARLRETDRVVQHYLDAAIGHIVRQQQGAR